MKKKGNNLKRAVLHLLVGIMLTGTLQGISLTKTTAEAATNEHTYTCPHVGYDELTSELSWKEKENEEDYSYEDFSETIGYNRTLGTSSTTTVFVSPSSLNSYFNGTVPSVGDTFSKSKLYNKKFEKYEFMPYVAECSLCEARTFNVYNNKPCYEITLSYNSSTGTYKVDKVVDVTRKELEDENCVLYSDIKTKTHTYTVEHDCEGYPYNQCKERLHEHEVLYDETEYEYECTCTQTNVESWIGTVKSSESGCGHTLDYERKRYYCRQCGQYLYEQYSYGCNNVNCKNYFKADSKYKQESHPGTHTYKAAGIPYECKNTAVYYPETRYKHDGYSTSAPSTWYSGNYDRNVSCDQCGYLMGNEVKDEPWAQEGVSCTYKSTVTSYKHYYYLKPVTEDSCYDVDYANLHIANGFDKEKEDSYTWYYCKTCGESYKEEHNGKTSDDMNETRNFLLADIEYDYYSTKSQAEKKESSINNNALHCRKYLTCTTAEYGEKICDKVVTKLIPLEESQTILAGDTINTKAYATFLDGHMELVECVITYDPTLYNETQTAILSYGEYSSTSDRTPRKAEISLYIERFEADVTLKVFPEGAGATTGTGMYTIGSDVSVSASAAMGYEFIGWYQDDTRVSDTIDYTFTMPASNTILTARFQPRIYALNIYSEFPSMGSVTGITEAAYNSSVTIEATPKTGFVFAGWYDGVKLVSTDAEYTFIMPYYSYSLMARFDSTEYTVSFDSNGGSACEPVQVPYLGVYGNLPIPIRTGYLFTGWTYNGDAINATTTMETKQDHILTATWEVMGPEFILVNYGDIYGKNSWSEDSDNLGQLGLTSARLNNWLPVPTKPFPYPGYDFVGWYRTENSKGNGDDLGSVTNLVTKDTVMDTAWQHTLHAGWKAITSTLTFDSNGGSSCSDMLITYDKTYNYHEDLPVPTKANYTFAGWYVTEQDNNGCGTQILPSSRVEFYAKEASERVMTVYAKWTQDAVNRGDDYDVPKEEPEDPVRGTVSRTDSKGLLYADDYNASTGARTDRQPYLAYDIYGADGTMQAEGVMPGTEELSFRATLGSWMLEYEFIKKTGSDDVHIYVTVPYRTRYTTADGTVVMSEQQTKVYDFMVPKTWSYWKIERSGLYYPESVTVENDVIAGGGFTVQVNREESDTANIPQYEVISYGNDAAHVKWPEYEEYEENGAVVRRPVLRIQTETEQVISSENSDISPEADNYLSVIAKNAAWADRQEAQVRSDFYTFGGETVLSDEWLTKNGAALDVTKLPKGADEIELTDYSQTYLSGIAMDELKPNGTYATTATILYVGDASNVGTQGKDVVKIELGEINDLNIHTPIACKGVITEGTEVKNEEHVLVLKDAINFFTLRVDNTGTHRLVSGYGAKSEPGVNDYRLALSGKSNIATAVDKNGKTESLNQVQFPFDIYVDTGNDTLRPDGTWDTTGDDCVKAGTWLTIGTREQRFYVPVTQKNGTYEVKVRTVAVNCPKDTDGEYQIAEWIPHGVNTDANDYMAEDSLVLVVKSYLKDFLIRSSTDPEAQAKLSAGTQAVTLKKGYTFTYELLSQGEFYGDCSEIKIIPEYVWVSPDETKRVPVLLYKGKEIPEQEDKICYAWEKEPILEGLEHWEVILQAWSGIGMVPTEVLCVAADTKQGYCATCQRISYVVGTDIECKKCHAMLRALHPFSLKEYSAQQTLTGKEDFFLQSGFLVIRFEILVKSEENVWYRFSDWESTELARDAETLGWNYVPGDVIRYDLGKSIVEDYEIGGSE